MVLLEPIPSGLRKLSHPFQDRWYRTTDPSGREVETRAVDVVEGLDVK